MADLPEGCNMVYKVLASTSRALWAINDDRQAFPAIPDVEIWSVVGLRTFRDQ